MFLSKIVYYFQVYLACSCSSLICLSLSGIIAQHIILYAPCNVPTNMLMKQSPFALVSSVGFSVANDKIKFLYIQKGPPSSRSKYDDLHCLKWYSTCVSFHHPTRENEITTLLHYHLVERNPSPKNNQTTKHCTIITTLLSLQIYKE